MLHYPNIDPVAFRLGPLAVHWYGIMYALGFISGWWLGRHRARRSGSPLEPQQVDDLILFVAVGVVIGGRVGYMLFYGLDQMLANPLALFQIWHGGMSFHGGLLGVIAMTWWFARRTETPFWRVIDFLAPLVPVGLGVGRIGNFINGELWGKPTTLPWGMVYPILGPEPRHPSQLYEFLLEGVVLFAILWLFSRRSRPTGAVSGLFLLCYGVFRFLVEFIRMPDPQLGYLAFGWFTMGQALSLPMIIAGLGLFAFAYRGRLAGAGSANARKLSNATRPRRR